MPFEDVIRALNRIGYSGPLSVEWEDSGINGIRRRVLGVSLLARLGPRAHVGRRPVTALGKGLLQHD